MQLPELFERGHCCGRRCARCCARHRTRLLGVTERVHLGEDVVNAVGPGEFDREFGDVEDAMGRLGL